MKLQRELAMSSNNDFDFLTTDINQPTLIEASAGTGKTYSLEHLVARLIVEGGNKNEGISVERILVVTFTRAAASELRMRVRKTLADYLARWDEFLKDGAIKSPDSLLSSWAERDTTSDYRNTIREKLLTALRQIDIAPIYTIHGFAQRILAEFSVSCENFSERTLANNKQTENIEASALDEFLRMRLPKDNPKLLEEILSHKKWKNALSSLTHETRETRKNITVRVLDKDMTLSTEVADWFKKAYVDFADFFAKEKARRKIMTFDDLLLNLLEELRREKSKPSKSNVIDAVRNKYQAVLIDEFQDTDPQQYEIFHTLFLDKGSSKFPPTKTVFFVGDPKQSIYSFRSAELDTYFQAKRDVAQIRSLSKNYRANPDLVKVVNTFFSTSASFDIEEAFSTTVDSCDENPPLMFVADGETEAQAIAPFEIWTACGDEDERTKNYEKANPYSYEPKAIANDIAKLLSGNYYEKKGTVFVHYGTEKERPIRPSDIAILVRQNKVADDFVKELSALGIRTSLPTTDSIFNSEEALEILFFLRAVLFPKNRKAYETAASTTLVGYALKDFSDERKISNLQAILLRAAKEIPLYGIYAVILRLMRERDPAKGFATFQRMLEEGNSRAIINLRHLLELLEAQCRKTDSLSGLLAWLTEKINRADANNESEALRPDNDTSLVNILTIHKSKGLEYPVVYLGKTYTEKIISTHKKQVFRDVDGNGARHLTVSPEEHGESKHAETEKRTAQESYRMAYVAMTRASHRLVLPLSFSISKKGKHSACDKNPYLLALSKNPRYPKMDSMQRVFAAFPTETHEIKELAEDFDKTHLETSASLKEKVPEIIPEEQPLYRNWTRSSFTAISRSLTQSHVLGDTEYLAFPAGTAAGTFLHKTMETAVDRAKILPESTLQGNDWLEHLVNRLFNQNLKGTIEDDPERKPDPAVGILEGLSAENYCREWMLRLFRRLLDTRFTESETLRSILLSRNLVAEADFLANIPNADFTVQTIEDTFKDLPQYSFTVEREGNADDASAPTLRKLKGFLTGQIDLVFQDKEDRYWILDWKSNKIEDPLGLHSRDFCGNYTREEMEKVMQGANYKLQALCYLVALKRYLVEVYESEEEALRHIGGALYVFLRGIGEPGNEEETGIYRMDMDENLRTAINRLDSAFGKVTKGEKQ